MKIGKAFIISAVAIVSHHEVISPKGTSLNHLSEGFMAPVTNHFRLILWLRSFIAEQNPMARLELLGTQVTMKFTAP